MSNDVDKNNNPANVKPQMSVKNIIPMTSTTLRLEAPARDGYHRHWFRGTGERIARAQQAGYTFVDAADVKVNNFDLGGDASNSGNTDMGSRVSVISGDDSDGAGQPGRLYLMECPSEFYEHAQTILAARNESVAEALRGGKIGAENDSNQKDTNARYIPAGTQIPDLFNPNKRRRG